jgi:hypothetical protein
VTDDIVEEVRRVRQELIKRFGGIKGYFQHCQAQERAFARRVERKNDKKRRISSRKGTKSK